MFTNIHIRFLRPKQTAEVVQLGASRLFELEAAGLFPPRFKTAGSRAAAHCAHEVEAVMTARLAGQTDDEIRVLVAQLVAARGRLLGDLLKALGIEATQS